MSPTPPSDSDQQLEQVLSRLRRIEERLDVLERSAPRFRVADDPPSPSVRSVPPPLPTRPPPVPTVETVVPREAASDRVPPPAPPRQISETVVGLTWLNRVGVLTVVLGVAFFFKYAVDNRLIGEAGRVLLGVFIAFASLGFAEVLWRRNHRIYAQGITGAGIGILYLSLYASSGFYHLIPAFAAFFSMFLATALAVTLALRYDAIAIAFLGFIGGYVTPLLLYTQGRPSWSLVGYLLLLQLGGFALIRRKTWAYLEPLLVAGTALIFLARDFSSDKAIGTVSAFAVYAVFWFFATNRTLFATQILAVLAIVITWPGPALESLWLNMILAVAGLYAAHRRSYQNLASIAFTFFWVAAVSWGRESQGVASVTGIASLTFGFLLFFNYAVWQITTGAVSKPIEKSTGKPVEPSLVFVAAGGPVYFAICYGLLHGRYHQFLGAFCFALAAVHLFVAYQMRNQLDPPESGVFDYSSDAFRPILLTTAVGVAFFTLAIPIQFAGFRITMAWSLEAAAFAWIAMRYNYRRCEIVSLALFGLAFLHVLLRDAWIYGSDVPHHLVANTRFLTFLVLGVCCCLGARWIRSSQLAVAVYVAGHCSIVCGLLMEVADWANTRVLLGAPSSLSTLATSGLLALYGVGLVTVGVTARSLVNRLLGLGLLALVTLKLYLFDVWQLQETLRIIAFVVLGILLLAASFLYSRFRHVLEKLWAET